MCTLYTNPVTIVPLYVVAFALGNRVLGNGDQPFTPPPELADLGLSAWLQAAFEWMAGLGQPLALGLLLLATLLALSGYVGVKTAWRVWLIRHWHRRRARRARLRPDDRH